MPLIEVDGITRDTEEAIKEDKLRDEKLEEVGFTVLRFTSWEVLNRMTDVDIIIGEWIRHNAKIPPPDPRKRGRSRLEAT